MAQRLGHHLVAQADELVDVELVVREQHEVLKMLGRGAGVMAHALQRVVDSGRGEQRERMRLARARLKGAVGDAVIHRRQIGQVEDVAHQLATLGAHRALDMFVLGEREVDRDGLARHAHFDRSAVVAQQELELFSVVIGEQVWPCQRGLVGAGAGDEAVTQSRIGARHRVSAHPDKGVAGPHPAGGRGAGDEVVQALTQVVDAAVVDGRDMRQSLVGVVEALGDDQDGRCHGRLWSRGGGSRGGLIALG